MIFSSGDIVFKKFLLIYICSIAEISTKKPYQVGKAQQARKADNLTVVRVEFFNGGDYEE
jgi:hypothetical protein